MGFPALLMNYPMKIRKAYTVVLACLNGCSRNVGKCECLFQCPKNGRTKKRQAQKPAASVCIQCYDALQFHFEHKQEITSLSVRIFPGCAQYICFPLHCCGVLMWQRSQAIYSIFEPRASLSRTAFPPQNGQGCNFTGASTIIFKNSFQIYLTTTAIRAILNEQDGESCLTVVALSQALIGVL